MPDAPRRDPFPPLDAMRPLLEQILMRDGRLAVVTVDVRRPADDDTAAPQARALLTHACDIHLRDLVGHEIRKDDLVAVRPEEPGLCHVFLSRAREKWQAEIGDLEAIAMRLRAFMYHRLLGVSLHLFGRGPRVGAGYGLSFARTETDADDRIRELLREAEAIAPLLAHKHALMRRMAVYDALVHRKVLVRFHPIVTLASHRVLGFEAETGALDETLFGRAGRLSDLAREEGVGREVTAVGFSEIFAKIGGLERGALVFIPLDLDAMREEEFPAAELRRLIDQYAVDEGRIVLQAKIPPQRSFTDGLRRLAERFPGVRTAAEIDEAWTAEDLSLLDGCRLDFLTAGRGVWRDAAGEKGAASFRHTFAAAISRRAVVLIAEGVLDAEDADAALGVGATAGRGTYYDNRADATTPAVEDVKDRFLQKKLLLSIYFKRGKNYFENRDFDKAVLEFSKVLEIDPLNAESYYYRGRAFFEDGVPAMAVKDYLALKDLDPAFPRLRLLEGLIAEKKGEAPRALAAYRDYLERTAESLDEERAFARTRLDQLEKGDASSPTL